MTRSLIALGIVLGLVPSALAQVKGPVVDRILIDVKTRQDAGLEDLAAGRSDLFDCPIDGATLQAIPGELRSKLEPYALKDACTEDLYINPYPNRAPYTAITRDGKVHFNPFAIREIRYAMNFLIDRGRIVAELMAGAGEPQYTPVIDGLPSSAAFAPLAGRRGFTAAGDEAKALADIDAALRKAAAADPKLVKNGRWWTYCGDPVSVKFLIRVDDPTMRLPEGRYIADQIEKAGIMVERIERDRAACAALWSGTDPASYRWNLYTEAWSGGRSREFWDGTVAQLYAPWFGYMPGGGAAGGWRYENEELDALTRACVNCRVATGGEYYAKLLAATDRGLQEAVRVFIASQTAYVCANRDSFLGKLLYGVLDGPGSLALCAADLRPGPDGRKTLRLSEYSPSGALFAAAWDPIGPDGFGDARSALVAANVSDREFGIDPRGGAPFPMTASWSGVKTGPIDFAAAPASGGISVPDNALLWNDRDQKWESGLGYGETGEEGASYDYAKVAAGKNFAWSQATFTFRFGRWQDGRPIDLNDYRYALARIYELCVRRGPEDRVYSESYAAAANPGLSRIRGFLFAGRDTITVYADACNPMDGDALAASLCPSLAIGASGHGIVVPWPIHEALRHLVAEGGPSGRAWSFGKTGVCAEVDLLSPDCVADIAAELRELARQKAVPAPLAGYLTPEEAADAYAKALAFIERYGHAAISNGGFMIESYDAQRATMALAACRDRAYPFARGWLARRLSTSVLRQESHGLLPSAGQ